MSAALFVIGFIQSREGTGMGFIVLAGLIILLTGTFLWTQGLETETIDHINYTDTTITPVYKTIAVSEGSELWMLSWTFVGGGLILMLVGLGKAAQIRRSQIAEQTEVYS